MSAALRMGPVLILRGVDQESLRLCALTVTDRPEPPGELATSEGERFSPERLLSRCGRVLWRTEFAVPASGRTSYGIAGRSHEIVAPQEDPRILFTACNGAEDPTELPADPERTDPWRTIAASHAREPFHLLIQGGDQIYADQVWHAHPALAPFRTRRTRAAGAAYDAAMDEEVRDQYFRLYMEAWADPEIAPILASVPSVMIWDDHDIFDGWGSWGPELQDSAVYQGLFRAARDSFAAFQLGVRTDERLPDAFLDPKGNHFAWLYRIGGVAVWAPDLRSERSRSQVMGEAGWRDVHAALKRARGCEHLFVVSSVPLLNTPLRGLERLHVALPGHQYFQDDLRDQWQSFAHAAEWARFTESLLRFKRETRARVTVLSGEIHMGARGVLTAPEGRIHQLTSSGVVHPPPPPLVARLMGLLSPRGWRISPRARFRMERVPGFGRRYLDERNWLSLEPKGLGYEAIWHAERTGDGIPLTLD